MAAITEVVAVQSGLTLYIVVHDSTAKVANGVSTEVYNGSNWSTYVNSVVEQGTSSYYTGTFPAYLPTGKYTLVVYQQNGASPALGDNAIGNSQTYWNGTIEEQTVASVMAATPVTLAASQPSLTIGTVASVTTIGATGLAAIQAQIQTLLNATAMPELTGIPTATPTMVQALMLAYMALRNQHTQSTLEEKVYNSAGTLVGTAQTTDDGSVFTKGRFS